MTNVTLRFTGEALQRLTALKQDTGADSYNEVVGNALRLYEWMIKMKIAGVDIRLVDAIEVLDT